MTLSRPNDLMFKTYSPPYKQDRDTKTLFKSREITDLSSRTDSIAEDEEREEAAILKVQTKIDEILEEDLKESTRMKDKKSYNHRYQEKDESDNVWISQPKWIPKEVLAAHDQADREAARGQKVNFLQGFLSKIGFMYYAVERKIFFYDIETMS
jgi:hypothetical protein